MSPQLKGYKIALWYCVICTVLFIALFAANAAFFGAPDTLLCVLCCLLYLLTTLLGVFLIVRIAGRRSALTDAVKIRAEVMKQTLSGIDMPFMLANEDGNVTWCNRSALTVFPALKAGESVYTICGLKKTEEGAMAAGNDGLTVADRRYLVHSVPIDLGKTSFTAVVLQDITAETEYGRALKAGRIIAADVVVDVSKDLMPDLREGYTKALSEVTNLLTDWAKDMNGLLWQYESGRYIMIFTAKRLADSEADGFNTILNRVKQITFGSDMMPMTVSVGIADVQGDGSLYDKYALARGAVDLALQRGGDQVVIKGRGKDVFYGGNAKRERFQMKLEARMLLTKITPYIMKASNVFIFGHKNADYDCFAASVGLAKLCTSLGKPAGIVVNRADKNISKALADVDKSEEFAPLLMTEDDAHNSVNPDSLLFIVDVNNPYLFASSVLAKDVPYILIDHHRKIPEAPVGEVLYQSIMSSVSSTSEIVAQMLEQYYRSSGELGKLLANLLLSGILLDTNRFSRDCGTGTFAAAQYLKREGANVEYVTTYFNLPVSDYTLELDVKHTVRVIGSCAVCVGRDDRPVADTTVTGRVADDALSLEGVNSTFAICRIGIHNADPPMIAVSARSDGTANVQVIIERLGGGGHHSNAGVQIACDNRVIPIISRALSPEEIRIDVVYRLILLSIFNMTVESDKPLPTEEQILQSAKSRIQN